MSRAFDELRPLRPAEMTAARPRDPSVDTFRQRFAPFSSDPVGDKIEEEQMMRRYPPRIAPPGTRERYGDPTKVISELPPTLNKPMPRVEARARGGPVEAGKPYVVGERGPEVVVPKQDGTVVAGALPPGFSYADEAPAVPDAGGLPPGFSYADEATPPPTSAAGPATEAPSSTPAPPSAIPVANPATTDPFERAAVMTRRSAAGARQETTMDRAANLAANIEPKGPISGLIALMRTAGQAAQGRRPDLLTNPENAIPEAVQGGIVGMSGRTSVVPGPRTPRPSGPLQLTSRLSREEAHDLEYAQQLEAARMEVKRVSQRLRDTGQMPPESSGAPIEMGGPVTPPEPPSNLLPPQLVREFGAVRKGVELKDKLNPGSPQNVSAREAAMEQAVKPHIKNILAVGQRTGAPIDALEAAVPEGVLSGALKEPGKAASVASWLQVYERAARAKFSPQAKASLGLATKNLNNNLGTDLTLGDVLKGL